MKGFFVRHCIHLIPLPFFMIYFVISAIECHPLVCGVSGFMIGVGIMAILWDEHVHVLQEYIARKEGFSNGDEWLADLKQRVKEGR